MATKKVAKSKLHREPQARIRSTALAKDLPCTIPLTAADVVTCLMDRQKEVPVSLWAAIRALPEDQAQRLLDNCLAEAIRRRGRQTVILLLDNGARLLRDDACYDPLLCVSSIDLLKHHPDYPGFSTKQIIDIFRSGGQRALKDLHEAGGNINQADDKGRTIAHHYALCVFRGMPLPSIVNYQLADNAGDKPIYLAFRYSISRACRLLRASAVDLSDPGIYADLLEVDELWFRIDFLIAIAKQVGRLAPEAAVLLSDENLQSLRIPDKDLAVLRNAALQQSTATVSEPKQEATCPRCGRASHPGQCRL